MRSWKRPRSLTLSLLGVLAVSALNIDPGHAVDGGELLAGGLSSG
jgi:hypothetical protein